MNKKALAIVAILIIAFCGWYFAGHGAKQDSGDTINIGYLAALTGDFAAYGTAEANSAQLIIDEVNAKGGMFGKKLKLVVYDTKSKSEDAVNAVRRMIENDHVCAVLGTNTSGITLSTAPIVNKAQVPQIATCATNPLVTVDEKGNVRPYSFRVCFIDPYQGKVAAELAVNDLGTKKAAILYNVGSDYAQGLREFFIKSFTELGGKVVADEGYRDADVDFRAQLTKVKEKGADVMFLPGMGKDMALIIKQAKELGINIKVIGGDGYADFMSEIAGDAMKGTYWVNHTYLGDPQMVPVFAKYKETYKDECKEFTNLTMAYDAAKWLVWAMEKAGCAEGPAIAKALENTKDVKLTHFTISVDPKDHNVINKPAAILKIADDLKGHFYKVIQPK